MSIKNALDRRWYPDFEDSWDGHAFRERILERITPQSRMLDIGAGRGATEVMRFKGLVKELIGTDVDPAVLQNSDVDRAVHTPDGSLQGVDDNSCDVVVSKHVLEHVEDPGQFFSEVARVLKPGGYFLAVTPNATHYVPLIARLTPLSFHKAFNKLRGREALDTFPTRYRANSASALKRWAAQSGLEVIAIERQQGRPEYMRLNPVLYAGGMVYERKVNRLGLDAFKAVIYVTMRKA